MGLLTLQEDRPTPKAVYNWKVYYCASVAAFCAVMIGYDSAFIGTTLALASFKKEFHWPTNAQKSDLISANIVSLYQAGAFFGALGAYVCGHFLGRKRGLQLFSLIFIIGAALMCGAKGSTGLGLIYGGRVLAGLGVGGASNLTPIYIAEISPPAIRGRLVGLYELGWQIGGLVGFWINYGVSENLPSDHTQWLIPFAVQLIPAGLMFFGLFFIGESPRWLMTKGKREKALKNLSWIRNLDTKDIYMLEEVSAIDAAIEDQRSTVGLGFWQPFKSLSSHPNMMYRFFLGSMLFLWQNASGINAINYYSPTVFKSIGVTGTNTSLLTTGIFGVIKTVGAIIWLLFLIDRSGRRNILIIGALGASICLWIIGGYIAIADPVEHPTKTLPAGGIAAMFFFYLWTAFYSPTWNGTPWVYNSEMFPIHLRTLGQASAAASNWLYNFLISRFTPNMFTKMGYGVYFFFAALSLLSVPFVFFLMPETKGIPLESMERLFTFSGPARKARRVVMEEIRRDEEEFRHNVEGSNFSILKEGDKAQHVETASV